MSYQEILLENKERVRGNLWVGYDLDGLFFNLAEPTLEIINDRFGKEFSESDIDDHWYVQTLLERIGASKKDISSFLQELYFPPNEHRVYEKSPVIPGAVDVVNGIHRLGHQPLAITSRPPGIKKTTEEQLRAAGVDWIKGDWADGGDILIRDQYYFKTMSGEEFKLRAIRGDFPDGKYKGFPGLHAHFDNLGELLEHPLAEMVKDKIFILVTNYNLNVPNENLVRNWWVFYKIVLCLSRNEDLGWLASHNKKVNVAQC